MTLQNFIFIIFSSLLLLSCQTEKDKEFEEFKNYTQSFGVEPSDSNIYVFIPGNQCQNCMRLDGNKLSLSRNEQVYIFSGFPEKTVSNFRHFYFDKENKMMGLKFIDYGNRIIHIQNGRLKTNEILVDLYQQLEQN
ncbi:MAG: hypothetical protein ACJ76F_01600 [Bacteroidia bacterium]